MDDLSVSHMKNFIDRNLLKDQEWDGEEQHFLDRATTVLLVDECVCVCVCVFSVCESISQGIYSNVMD